MHESLFPHNQTSANLTDKNGNFSFHLYLLSSSIFDNQNLKFKSIHNQKLRNSIPVTSGLSKGEYSHRNGFFSFDSTEDCKSILMYLYHKMTQNYSYTVIARKIFFSYLQTKVREPEKSNHCVINIKFRFC